MVLYSGSTRRVSQVLLDEAPMKAGLYTSSAILFNAELNAPVCRDAAREETTSLNAVCGFEFVTSTRWATKVMLYEMSRYPLENERNFSAEFVSCRESGDWRVYALGTPTSVTFVIRMFPGTKPTT